MSVHPPQTRWWLSLTLLFLSSFIEQIGCGFIESPRPYRPSSFDGSTPAKQGNLPRMGTELFPIPDRSIPEQNQIENDPSNEEAPSHERRPMESLPEKTTRPWQEDRIRQGEATYYIANGIGNCSLPVRDTQNVAALNTTDYASARWCGACARISGPKGDVIVKISDRCPGCGPGDIDLSSAAFAQIAELEQGRIDIRWQLVTCPPQGNLQYHYKEGSTQWWAAIQIRNHHVPLEEVWIQRKGQWIRLQRLKYGYYLSEDGVDTKPFRIRVIGVNQKRIEEVIAPPARGDRVQGTKRL
ncbi:MAG: expansin EXLX1 family cellulose-binding protein [Myxococcota bacterium]